MSGPFMDPAQVFADPSQMGAPQEPQQQQQQQEPPPDQQQAGQGQQQPGYEHAPIDLEGCLADAIEAGCHLASAAVAPEDYERFSRGVSFLAAAFKDVQPQQIDPAHASIASTALQVDQKDRQAQLQAQTQREVAASRPTPAGSSARG